MVTFPHCKVNIGLQILRRRCDGYHDIATVMYPVPWTDILEIVPAQDGKTSLTVTGNKVDCLPEKNLVIKAYQAIKQIRPETPEVNIYLRKIIPDQAGLGGGSADAAFTLRMLNEMFNLRIAEDELREIAASLGADCAFFLQDSPMLCTGKGEILAPIELSFKGKYIVIAKPRGSVSTAQAYSSITPNDCRETLAGLLSHPLSSWPETVVNDFQPFVLANVVNCPEILEILTPKAVYASLSGSGSAMFGIYNSEKEACGTCENLKSASIVTNMKMMPL